MKVLTNLDLNKNEIQNVSLQKLSADPSSANLVAGMVWMNTSSSPYVVKYYNGSEIITLGALNFETSSSNIKMDGTASVGTLSTVARADHIHPSDTSRVPTTRTVNGKALSSNIELKADDIVLAADGISLEEFVNDYLGSAAYKAVDTSITSGSTSINLPTSSAVANYVSTAIGAADAMRFKGTIGTGGTVTSLPTSNVKVGDTYRVITAGTYASQVCEVGDLIIAYQVNSAGQSPAWTVAQTNIEGAITSISAGDGISVTGSGASRTVELSSEVYCAYQSYRDSVKYYANPALTSSGGVCTWYITTEVEGGMVTINEISTGNIVLADTSWDNNGDIQIKIISSSNIAANTYNATVIGK